jgi:hypothetical protein
VIALSVYAHHALGMQGRQGHPRVADANGHGASPDQRSQMPHPLLRRRRGRLYAAVCDSSLV